MAESRFVYVTYIHTHNLQRHAELLAQIAAVHLEGIGGCLQSVMHVDGTHLPRPSARARDKQSR